MIAPKPVLLFLLLAFTRVPASLAQNPGLALSAGLFDIGQSEKAAELGLEYRFEAVRLFDLDLDLVPALGVTANEDGAFWAYAGFRWDLSLGKSWVLTPSLAFALYEQGDSKDLGHLVEFRSGLEIARRFAKGRLGLTLYHLSNASISDHNPGEESLNLTWSFGR